MAQPGTMSLFEQPSIEVDENSAEQTLLLRILREIEEPQPKRPLQCVTYKMPLPHYLRMKQAAQRWRLPYSDLLRIAMLYLTPALEQPSGELLGLLEAHCQAEIEKQRERSLKRKPSLRHTSISDKAAS